jgi:hypothetical protein
MTLTVYYGYNTFKVLGTIETLYDRIVKVDFDVPIRYEYPYKIIAEMEAKEKGETLPVSEKYTSTTQYEFSLEKLSKADNAYRVGKCKYRLISEDLSSNIRMSYIYISPTWRQNAIILFHLKRYFVQGKEFRHNIYNQIISHFVVAILTFIGTVAWFRSCGNTKSQSGSPSTLTSGDSTQIVNQVSPANKNGVVDSTSQHFLEKNKDSLPRHISLKDSINN